MATNPTNPTDSSNPSHSSNESNESNSNSPNSITSTASTMNETLMDNLDELEDFVDLSTRFFIFLQLKDKFDEIYQMNAQENSFQQYYMDVTKPYMPIHKFIESFMEIHQDIDETGDILDFCKGQFMDIIMAIFKQYISNTSNPSSYILSSIQSFIDSYSLFDADYNYLVGDGSDGLRNELYRKFLLNLIQ